MDTVESVSQSVSQSVASSILFACFKVDGLIMHCVQSALSMVKDGSRQEQRETKRVNIVLKALKQSKTIEQGKTIVKMTISNCNIFITLV